jgi:hypothetical protein
VSEVDGQWFQATGNWSNVQYVGGSSTGADQLEVAAYDATIGSFVYSSTFTATTKGIIPTITAQSFSVFPNRAVSVAGRLSVSNPSGDSLTAYWVEDLGGGSGHLTVGGVSEALRAPCGSHAMTGTGRHAASRWLTEVERIWLTGG